MFGLSRLGLARDKAGSLSTVTALLMPALITAAGIASDTIQWTLVHRSLQQQAETAALAGAEALSQDRPLAETVQAKLAATGGPALARIELGSASGSLAGDPLVVRVRLTTVARLPFAGLFTNTGMKIRAEAAAGLMVVS